MVTARLAAVERRRRPRRHCPEEGRPRIATFNQRCVADMPPAPPTGSPWSRTSSQRHRPRRRRRRAPSGAVSSPRRMPRTHRVRRLHPPRYRDSTARPGAYFLTDPTATTRSHKTGGSSAGPVQRRHRLPDRRARGQRDDVHARRRRADRRSRRPRRSTTDYLKVYDTLTKLTSAGDGELEPRCPSRGHENPTTDNTTLPSLSPSWRSRPSSARTTSRARPRGSGREDGGRAPQPEGGGGESTTAATSRTSFTSTRRTPSR